MYYAQKHVSKACADIVEEEDYLITRVAVNINQVFVGVAIQVGFPK